MGVEIRKIAIRNFKNLKNIVIYPKKFNVLIGPNGSGKTNFLEFFKLLRKIYVERNPYPFLEWDGYENVIWRHQRGLPIKFEIETTERTTFEEFIREYWAKDIRFGKDLSFEIIRRISANFWADSAEDLKILKEKAEIEIPELNYRFSIEKAGDTWKVLLKDKEYEISNKDVKSLLFEISRIIEEGFKFWDIDYTEDLIDAVLGIYIFKKLPEDAKKNLN